MSDEFHKQYEGTFGYYLATRILVVTSNQSVIEDLLSSPKYNKKSWGYKMLDNFIGNGLVSSYGDLWKQRRRLITPAFHFDILNGFLPVMERCSKELIQILGKHACEETSFNAINMGTKLTMAVICETSMGYKISLTKESQDNDFKSLYENATIVMSKRFYRPWLMNDFIYSLTQDGKTFFSHRDALRNWVTSIIEERIRFRKDETGDQNLRQPKRKIVIDVLLDAYEKGEIGVEGMVDEVTTLVFAGYETTSSNFAFSLYCLGRNPECQAKLYEEISEFGKSENFNLDDLKRMAYLDLVIKETLRLHVTLNAFSRDIKEGTILGGKIFPECMLVVDVRNLNHNEENWDNPMSFIPERFENFDERKKDKAFMFIPFSAGPRNCVGQRFALMELKIALFHCVKNFEFFSLQNEFEIEQTFQGVNTSTNGLHLKVKRRNISSE
uniref:Cytochrome P450 n=2 Tax=Clytia hemisphaerica TaxID=252671 RepID=A0A7M5V3N5_9CNID